MDFGVLDYIFGALITAAVLRCLLKGFIAEIVAVAGVGGGILCAVLFSPVVAELLVRWLGDSIWNRVIAFLLIFLVVYLVVKVFEGLLYRLLDALQLENLDRALGFFLGLLEGLVVTFLLILLLAGQNLVDLDSLLNESLLVRFVATILPSYLPAEVVN